MLKYVLGLIVIGIVSISSAFAHDEKAYESDTLILDHAWIKATPPRAKVAGGYITITNQGTDADRLIGGSASFAAMMHIHEMRMDEGIMRMRPLMQGLEIPAGETITLKPGGFHLMFMKLKERLKRGQSHSVTLEFEKAGAIELDFTVKGIGAKSAH